VLLVSGALSNEFPTRILFLTPCVIFTLFFLPVFTPALYYPNPVEVATILS